MWFFLGGEKLKPSALGEKPPPKIKKKRFRTEGEKKSERAGDGDAFDVGSVGKKLKNLGQRPHGMWRVDTGVRRGLGGKGKKKPSHNITISSRRRGGPEKDR